MLKQLDRDLNLLRLARKAGLTEELGAVKYLKDYNRDDFDPKRVFPEADDDRAEYDAESYAEACRVNIAQKIEILNWAKAGRIDDFDFVRDEEREPDKIFVLREEC